MIDSLGGRKFLLSVLTLATALSFPGATIITLAGGAVFGLGWATSTTAKPAGRAKNTYIKDKHDNT